MKKLLALASIVQALYWLTPATEFNVVEAAETFPTAAQQVVR